jgi:hypothetical protein
MTDDDLRHRLDAHIRQRLALLARCVPLEDKAKWQFEARRNELEQMLAVVRGDSYVGAPAATEPT